MANHAPGRQVSGMKCGNHVFVIICAAIVLLFAGVCRPAEAGQIICAVRAHDGEVNGEGCPVDAGGLSAGASPADTREDGAPGESITTPGGMGLSARGEDAAPVENYLLPVQDEIEQQYMVTLRSAVFEYEEEMAMLCDRAACEPGGEEAAERCLAAAWALEENCDGYFYGVLAGYHGELQGGYPDDAARQVQDFYESTKQLCYARLAETVGKMPPP